MRNGSGTYNLATGNPVSTGTTISSTWANNTLADIASALTQSLSKDGQTTLTGNLPAGNNKLTGLSAGSTDGDSLRFEQLFSQGTLTDIASASTVDIGAQRTNFLRITGTTGITSFGTNYNGPRFLIFADAVTLTHSATLVLPGATSITTSANDAMIAIPISGGWQVIVYQRAAGNGPAFSAYQSAAQSVPTGVFTKIRLQSEEFDTDNAFDSTTNYRFQPAFAGFYQINGRVSFGTASDMACSIYKFNGSSLSEYKRGSLATSYSASVSALVYLNGSTDYLELFVYQQSPGSLNIDAASKQTYFQGYLARSA